MPIKMDSRALPRRCVVRSLVAAFALTLFFPSTALAHKVYIYAWLEGDTVHTESYFGAKSKVRQGVIRVFDLSGQKLLEGRTDEKGEFSFRMPVVADLRIVVEAGMGHKGEFILKTEKTSGTSGPETVQSVGEERKQVSPGAVSADGAQIRMIVEQALDARLKPILRQLAEIRKERGPGFGEVVGGIGYILGLMGLVLYFKSRGKDGGK